MIPLNEYPKEELEVLLSAVEHATGEGNVDYQLKVWRNRIYQAISDQEFKEKELPFKTE